METKRIELKRLDEDGTGLAKIATLSAVDHDGDTYQKGAFGSQPVKVLAGHSWDGVPIGKGRVFEKGDEVLAEFKLNLETTAGKEWHQALKFDLANGEPLQEWSYGFKVLESVDETRDGKSVRVLKSLEVFEVSPVVKGAGIDTGTVAIKAGQTFEDQIAAITTQVAAVTKRAAEIADLRDGRERPFNEDRLAELATVKANLDALIERLAPPEDAPDATADRLLAEFTAIRCGQGRAE